MKIIEAFTATVPKRYAIAGNFFRLNAASGATAGTVSITFSKAGLTLPLDLIGADPGDWARSPAGFDEVNIVSTINQTVGFQIMRGDVGSDAVVGTVAVSSITGFDSAMSYGASFQSTIAIVSGTPMNVVAAASNTAGIRLHDAEAKNFNGTANGECSLIARATAPTLHYDADVLCAAQGYWTDGANKYTSARLLVPTRIAAGRRLDFMVQISDTGGLIKRALYTLL